MYEIIYGKEFYYPDGLSRYLREAGTLDAHMQDGLKVFEEETWAVINPRTVLNNLMTPLEKYVDHISDFLECDCSDFIVNSKAIKKMSTITQAFIDFRIRARDEQNAIRDTQLRNLRKIADSQVAGLDFGIISNSILAHLVYSDMNDSKKKRQQNEADKYYLQESDNIYRQNSDALSDIVFDFSENYYRPILKQGFKEFFVEAFNKYMSILDKKGEINLSEINATQYDIHASNSVLNSRDAYSSAYDRIYDAFSLCPYNPEVYQFAYQNKCLTDKLYMLSLRLGVGLRDSIEINDADTENIKVIKMNLADGYFPVRFIVPIIEKNLIFIDSKVISNFSNLSKDELDDAVKNILNHLELERKKAELAKKDLITSDLLAFIERTKILFSLNEDVYEKIVSKAFEKEIKKVVSPFEILLQLSASDEEFASYARSHSIVFISGSNIISFIQLYEILKNEQMDKIISLVGGLDIELFYKFLNDFNAKLKDENQKYLAQEAAKKAERERIERERRAAEEKRKQIIENKKRELNNEIQKLNIELKTIGLALFGKKARRKLELREQITKKQDELNELC